MNQLGRDLFFTQETQLVSKWRRAREQARRRRERQRQRERELEDEEGGDDEEEEEEEGEDGEGDEAEGKDDAAELGPTRRSINTAAAATRWARS